MDWDNFLMGIAFKCQLPPAQAEIFLYRWNAENKEMNPADLQEKIYKEKLIEPDTYTKRQTEVYGKLTKLFPELQGVKTGKSKILKDCLEREFKVKSRDQKLQNRYKVISELSIGGDDEVGGIPYALCKGEDLECDHQFCVIKRIKKGSELTRSEELFKREKNFLLTNRYARIPRLLASYEESDYFVLVYDFIEGKSFKERISEGEVFSEFEVRDILMEVLKILSPIHQKQIVLRSISAANIIQHESNIFLVNPRPVESLHLDKMTIAGFEGYMPSEQRIGKPVLASDIYAIGLIGIQLLTRVANIHDLINIHDWLKNIKTEVAPDLSSVLNRMIHADPSRRYKNADEALDIFKEL